jgi:hypothetical protein
MTNDHLVSRRKPLKSANLGILPHRMSNRKFAIAVGGILLTIGLFGWVVFDQIIDWALVGGGVILATAAVAPGVFLPVNLLWHRIGNSVGAIINWVTLASIFYLVLTPVGLTLRLFGHDTIGRKENRSLDSYFSPVRRQSDAETMRDWF